MGDIVIIGGGLTGLAAAWELERLGVPYRLIELKPRLGGRIRTERRDGFVLDAAHFLLNKQTDWPFLRALGLDDALVCVRQTRNGEQVLFRDGTQTLVDALVARIARPVMLRMAVSSVGYLDDRRFGVCLENGLLLEASGLIVTAPARHAEHLLRSLQPEAAYRLLDYRYDSVARVSLGYCTDDMDMEPLRATPPDDYPIIFWQSCAHPARVPAGHALIRVGVRLAVEDHVPSDLPLQLAAAMRWPLNPVTQQVDYWPEADSLTAKQPAHWANMAAVERLLPPRVALAGSDYLASDLAGRVNQGRAAALQVAEALV